MLHAGHGVVGMGHKHDVGTSHHDKFQRNLTVGTVQREIRIGMSSAEVIEVMGSPNVVSTDADRNEVAKENRRPRRRSCPAVIPA